MWAQEGEGMLWLPARGVCSREKRAGSSPRNDRTERTNRRKQVMLKTVHLDFVLLLKKRVKWKYAIPFCVCVLAMSFWMAAGKKKGPPPPAFLRFSRSLVSFSTLQRHHPCLGRVFVAPSWWQPTIEAEPERWVAVIHASAEQTSLKGRTCA